VISKNQLFLYSFQNRSELPRAEARRVLLVTTKNSVAVFALHQRTEVMPVSREGDYPKEVVRHRSHHCML
jgi:hypothetical protein